MAYEDPAHPDAVDMQAETDAPSGWAGMYLDAARAEAEARSGEQPSYTRGPETLPPTAPEIPPTPPPAAPPPPPSWQGQPGFQTLSNGMQVRDATTSELDQVQRQLAATALNQSEQRHFQQLQNGMTEVQRQAGEGILRPEELDMAMQRLLAQAQRYGVRQSQMPALMQRLQLLQLQHDVAQRTVLEQQNATFQAQGLPERTQRIPTSDGGELVVISNGPGRDSSIHHTPGGRTPVTPQMRLQVTNGVRDRMNRELTNLSRGGTPPTWARGLTQGTPEFDQAFEWELQRQVERDLNIVHPTPQYTEPSSRGSPGGSTQSGQGGQSSRGGLPQVPVVPIRPDAVVNQFPVSSQQEHPPLPPAPQSLGGVGIGGVPNY